MGKSLSMLLVALQCLPLAGQICQSLSKSLFFSPKRLVKLTYIKSEIISERGLH